MTKKSWGDKRGLHTKVKTAKGRKSSSTRWLQRQLNDPYVQLAKEEGYLSRAAYKLLELNEKFHFLKKGKTLLDLGAAPGGWTQVAVKKLGKGKVIALDIQEMVPIEGATNLQCDFTSQEVLPLLNDALKGQRVDIIASDMAPSSTGHSKTDHLRITYLCELAYDFAKENLAPEGVFICKMFQGGAEKELLDKLKKDFKKIHHMKPPSSRKESSEAYLVATGYGA